MQLGGAGQWQQFVDVDQTTFLAKLWSQSQQASKFEEDESGLVGIWTIASLGLLPNCFWREIIASVTELNTGS